MLFRHRSDSQVVHDDLIENAELPALVAYQPSPDIDILPANQCSICDKHFANADGVKAHKADKHPECPTCHQVFNHSDIRTSLNNLRRHQETTGHCYCHQHDLTFRDTRSYREHERHEAQVTGFECLACNRHFGCQQGLDDHLSACSAPNATTTAADDEVSAGAQAVVPAVEEVNLRCEACNRDFMDVHAQRQHKCSVNHNPLSNLACFLSPLHRQVFPSPSAFSMHRRQEQGNLWTVLESFTVNSSDQDLKNVRDRLDAGQENPAKLDLKVEGVRKVFTIHWYAMNYNNCEPTEDGNTTQVNPDLVSDLDTLPIDTVVTLNLLGPLETNPARLVMPVGYLEHEDRRLPFALAYDIEELSFCLMFN